MALIITPDDPNLYKSMRTPEEIRRRQELCLDLIQDCQDDLTVLEQLVDDHVYDLTLEQVKEYEELCTSILSHPDYVK